MTINTSEIKVYDFCYVSEAEILKNAGLNPNDTQLTTSDLKIKATNLIASAQSALQNSICFDRLTYKLGFGRIRRLENMASDLNAVANAMENDIENGKAKGGFFARRLNLYKNTPEDWLHPKFHLSLMFPGRR